MGELFAATGARAVGAGLSDLFSAGNIASTKARVILLRSNGFPGLLRRRANAPMGTPTRQMTLRFAAWLLTSHIAFVQNDPSRGNLKHWLRWLTWLKKEHPRAHRMIRNTIEDNLDAGSPKPMIFTWSPVSNEEDFKLTITPPAMGADFFTIEVLAKDGPSVPGEDEDDSDRPPPD
jgi:hypothetical protein